MGSTGGQSITVFGSTFYKAGSGGCTVNYKKSAVWDIDAAKDRTLGIQWNIARVSSTANRCDNACRQLTLDLLTCSLSLVDSSHGYCSTVATPTWTPQWITSTISGKCVIRLTADSTVDNHADRCSCKWGQYPCTCPGEKCAGRKSDIDTRADD